MPTRLDFTHTARFYGLEHQRIERQAQFRPALQSALQSRGVTLIEIMLDREKSLAMQQDYLERIKVAASSH
jgi:2-succinyl-5-enolpyruvyl-6-hydroxy-3-cyclohexene-1-carboxylate synthase